VFNNEFVHSHLTVRTTEFLFHAFFSKEKVIRGASKARGCKFVEFKSTGRQEKSRQLQLGTWEPYKHLLED
jgi:hypothetical protein